MKNKIIGETMKQLKFINNALIIVFILSLSACSSTATFPSSSIVPAANITAKKKKGIQNNFTLEITSQYLASADRLDPPGNNYSIWIVSTKYGVKNVGQLNVINAEKNIYKTTTPFDFEEVIITVEDQGDLQYPQGVEIARTKF